MQSRGFSLIELLTIVGILSILYAIGTLSFNTYQKRYRTDAQTRFLFSEIQKARADAVCQRRGTRIKVYRDRFERYSTYQDDTSGVQPLQTHTLRFPVIWSQDGEVHIIDFEPQGITDSEPREIVNVTKDSAGSICLEDSNGTGGVDSITVSATRTRIGKKRPGNDCIGDYITYK